MIKLNALPFWHLYLTENDYNFNCDQISSTCLQSTRTWQVLPFSTPFFFVLLIISQHVIHLLFFSRRLKFFDHLMLQKKVKVCKANHFICRLKFIDDQGIEKNKSFICRCFIETSRTLLDALFDNFIQYNEADILNSQKYKSCSIWFLAIKMKFPQRVKCTYGLIDQT
jgi:hypothetical protein